MSNVTEETEALAKQLCAIYVESMASWRQSEWDEMHPIIREAWVQVAQFIEARESKVHINKDVLTDNTTHSNIGTATIYRKVLEPGEIPPIVMWDEPDHR